MLNATLNPRIWYAIGRDSTRLEKTNRIRNIKITRQRLACYIHDNEEVLKFIKALEQKEKDDKAEECA